MIEKWLSEEHINLCYHASKRKKLSTSDLQNDLQLDFINVKRALANSAK